MVARRRVNDAQPSLTHRCAKHAADVPDLKDADLFLGCDWKVPLKPAKEYLSSGTFARPPDDRFRLARANLLNCLAHQRCAADLGYCVRG